MAPSKQPVKTWQHNVIRGQQCIVENFGLGRVTDYGHEEHLGGYDYIAVRFYADPSHPQIRRFNPDAVTLIHVLGAGMYKAYDGTKKKRKGHVAA